MLHTLEWEYEPDYELFGLSSTFGCHRLAWSMNRVFGWSMSCDQDVVSTHGRETETVHPSMRYVNEADGIAVTLVLNRLAEGMLLEGVSGLDYLVLLNHHELAAHEFLAQLRQLREVSYAIALDPEASGAIEPLSVFD